VPDGSRSFVTSSPDLDRVAVLFRAHFEFVRRVLRRCGVMEANLDDAVQEVFLVVHRRIDDFEGRSSETTWLYAIAVRVASTLRRSASREHARRERAGAQMHSASEADPERELSRSEAAALLDRLLDELDTTKRTVFVLAELEGVPVPEIAQIMDANVRTTHSRLRLARKRFNDALQRHHAQESGRARRASVRTLARHSEPAPAQPARARAAWAGLALRISDGATPMAIAWTGAGAAATTTGFWLPLALTVGLGVGGLGVAAATVGRDQQVVPAETAESRRSVPTEAVPRVEEKTSTEAPLGEPLAPLAPAPAPAPAARSSAEPDTRRTSPQPRSTARPRPTPALGVSTLEAETALLEKARAKLESGDPDGTLRALRQHAAQFPHGLLVEERKATRVKALCEAGRTADARRAAGSDAGLKAVVSSACE